MILITAFSTVILFSYLLILLWALYGLRKPVSSGDRVNDSAFKLAVIIPYRNESENLAILLKDMMAQNYPKEQFEIILINDHSSDGSKEIVDQFMEDSGISIFNLTLPHEKFGKKAALKHGLKQTDADVILQTDADCRMSPDWIKAMADSFDEGIILSMGPVIMKPGPGFWSRFAALEFLSLQAVGAGFANTSNAFMGSAANMAYRRDLANSNALRDSRLSGDDVFLIQQASKLGGIKFNMNKSSRVYTDAPSGFAEFISQRARWGGKTTSYQSPLAILIASVVALLAFIQVAMIPLFYFYPDLVYAFTGILLIKGFFDFLLLRKFAVLTGQEGILQLVAIAAVVYPFYIIYTAFIIITGRVNWKNRRFRPAVE